MNSRSVINKCVKPLEYEYILPVEATDCSFFIKTKLTRKKHPSQYFYILVGEYEQPKEGAIKLIFQIYHEFAMGLLISLMY